MYMWQKSRQTLALAGYEVTIQYILSRSSLLNVVPPIAQCPNDITKRTTPHNATRELGHPYPHVPSSLQAVE